MRIIITGGSGFIGRALSENLVNDKHEVIILSRNSSRVVGLPKASRTVEWDGKTADGWGYLVDGADIVINLAGESIAGDIPFGTRWTKKRKEAILNSRVNAGKAVVEAVAAAQVKPKLLVQVSGVDYYGSFAGAEMVTEDSPNGDSFLANVCRQWEDATKPVEAMGVRRVILRTALVLSKEEGILPWMVLPFRFFIGGKFGSGKQYVHWIHIEDVVRAIRFLIENEGTSGAYNLAAPQPLPNQEFAKMIGTVMGRPSFFPTPGFIFNILFGEASALLLRGLNVHPARLTEAGYKFEFNEVLPALKNLLQNGKDGLAMSAPRAFSHRFTVEVPLQAVADFHGDSHALRRLTPPPVTVQFHEVEPLAEGSRADFTMWLGPIPVHWVAFHSQVNRMNGFTDTQLSGPFNNWVHRHIFQPVDERTTAVIDEVSATPGSGLFRGVVSRFMWLNLRLLFAYRAWITRRALEKKVS